MKSLTDNRSAQESRDRSDELDLSKSKEQLLRIVLELDADNYFEKNGWIYYGQRGLAFAMLKYKYFVLCFDCKSKNPDMFYVLACKKCVYASKGNTFFAHLKARGVKKSDGYINLLIKIAGLLKKFPNLKFTCFNYKNLNKFMNYLPNQLEKDKRIWINTH